MLAFIVLDDEVHAILACEGIDVPLNQTLVQDVADAYEAYVRGARGFAGCVKENTGWSRLPGKGIVNDCEELHGLAVSRVYAADPADFWWSTVNHYKGRYEWRFLNTWWTMALKDEILRRRGKGKV